MTVDMFDFTNLIPTDEQFEINKQLGRGDGNCIICGRRMPTHGGAAVHLSAVGFLLFPADEDHDNDPASQGWLDVGSECAKKLPARYVYRQAKR